MRKVRKLMLAMMLAVLAVMVVGCSPEPDPNNGGDHGGNDTVIDHSGSIDGRDFVDLALPSGTLWATCNVGAESPEDQGNYFAWGETETKEMYDWKMYRYSTYDEDRYVLTKYCTNSFCGYHGMVDSLAVLEPVDDAARVHWGDQWRMPTADEWRELIQNTTCELIVQNDVRGRLFTGSNGNSIFLPDTGFYLELNLICTGLGIYWTSSLQTDAQVSAWSFHSDGEEFHICGTYERSRGHCVRAVRSMQ